MSTDFFAYISRMKLIDRWSLMRNVHVENIQEHSHQVAVLAHALCEIDRVFFGGKCSSAKAVELALFHDASEVITGDLPTPVKYFNPEIKKSYGHIENIARNKLLSMLPDELAEIYRPLIFGEDGSREAFFVKAADKLSAYTKCLEELSAGNKEFVKASQSISEQLEKYRSEPAVAWFMNNCLEGYSKTLDELA